MKEKIEELENENEELKDEVQKWKQKYEDLLEDLQENYRPISAMEQYGISNYDFV